jgi:hypothetical protein
MERGFSLLALNQQLGVPEPALRGAEGGSPFLRDLASREAPNSVICRTLAWDGHRRNIRELPKSIWVPLALGPTRLTGLSPHRLWIQLVVGGLRYNPWYLTVTVAVLPLGTVSKKYSMTVDPSVRVSVPGVAGWVHDGPEGKLCAPAECAKGDAPTFCISKPAFANPNSDARHPNALFTVVASKLFKKVLSASTSA